ncbi:hypothetical protein ASPVEDRAFT_75073 [Aspergillus versicolor CBS 583.65]|uniref:Zn(2)-C6 fungal-type domain-containing protein n=1 Tax=Aspergillus versicolor CBS 583.65 TaxID=1036611 RepID=A0A1L9PWG1_ASPVE|nr:uncharacterized protein ASPVEDRAFT_75073 [Aspergillus versicolor CBS 583.65]OJJ05813.1 hypothetical protein ASPVEDRAFT_75073 [Aspergillus versicolor CBS 583.65]
MASSQSGQNTDSLSPATRSCHRCNQKKIRCSKSQPCSSCVESNSDCVFPGPGRAPRRKKRPLKAELVSRLKSLEQQVRGLTTEPGNGTLHDSLDGSESVAEATASEDGRLMPGEGSTRYVTHDALVGLMDQIENLKDIANSPSIQDYDDHGQFSTPDEDSPNGNQFLFGYSSMASSLDAFHPSPAHSQILCKAFEENVAPVVMIFHKPTIHALISNSSSGSSIDRASEAIVFAIYFAAITSMSPEQCSKDLGQDRPLLIQHYRFATQQALARANFMQSQTLPLLQAATLFLSCLRHPGDADFVWAMTAALVRMAQGLGIHRDGTHFGLSAYETEMRRRLWWAIYLLDSRSSEFRGIGPQISEGDSYYDTRLLLNIDDTDLSPDQAQQQPEKRVGFTESTFCTVRCEMTVLYRQAHLNSSSSGGPSPLGERLRRLDHVHSRLQKHYLQFCDTSVPIQWVTATVIRLALARSWLLAHLPQGTIADAEIAPGTEDPLREQLLSTAVEVIDFAYLLETDTRTSQWSWLFEGYPQWHAVLVVLAELCARPQSSLTDRAWAVTVKAVERWIDTGFRAAGITPKIIFGLMERAAAAQGYIWDGVERKKGTDGSVSKSV